MGRIAMPSLIAQAAAPSVGVLLLEVVGLDGALVVFLATAALNVLLTIGLFAMTARSISINIEIRRATQLSCALGRMPVA
jgi:hypothetical protein